MQAIAILVRSVRVYPVPGERNSAVTFLFVVGQQGESTEAELVLVSSDGDPSLRIPLGGVHGFLSLPGSGQPSQKQVPL